MENQTKDLPEFEIDMELLEKARKIGPKVQASVVTGDIVTENAEEDSE